MAVADRRVPRGRSSRGGVGDDAGGARGASAGSKSVRGGGVFGWPVPLAKAYGSRFLQALDEALIWLARA